MLLCLIKDFVIVCLKIALSVALWRLLLCTHIPIGTRRMTSIHGRLERVNLHKWSRWDLSSAVPLLKNATTRPLTSQSHSNNNNNSRNTKISTKKNKILN